MSGGDFISQALTLQLGVPAFLFAGLAAIAFGAFLIMLGIYLKQRQAVVRLLLVSLAVSVIALIGLSFSTGVSTDPPSLPPIRPWRTRGAKPVSGMKRGRLRTAAADRPAFPAIPRGRVGQASVLPLPVPESGRRRGRQPSPCNHNHNHNRNRSRRQRHAPISGSQSSRCDRPGRQAWRSCSIDRPRATRSTGPSASPPVEA